MASIIGNFAERFGDGPVAFSMERYESTDKKTLWRFGVSRYIGRDHLIEVDANVSEMAAMRRFLDKAIEAVNTDGGRKADPA